MMTKRIGRPSIPTIALGAFAAAALMAACAPADDGRHEEPDRAAAPAARAVSASAERITGGAASLDQLASGLVAAISAADSAALESYRLTEHEHNEVLWPEFPVAQEREHVFPVELAWENIQVRNAAGIRALLQRFGGEPLRYDGVDCSGEPDEYLSFTVLRDCRVIVVAPDGDVRRLQIFRSVVVRDGRYKLVRFERETE